MVVGTRPDVDYAIGKLSQHSANPRESHWAGVKRVMRYVQGTRNLGIVFNSKSKSSELLGFSEADWAGCQDSGKSTSGCVFKFWVERSVGVLENKLWSRLRRVKLSTLHYVRHVRRRLGCVKVVADVLELDSDPTIMMGCDNAGTISFAQNESINRRNKHVDVKYHYVRDVIKRGVVSLSHCPCSAISGSTGG